MKNTMKNILAIIILVALIFTCNNLFAGNEDRAGEAGAS